MSLKSLRIFLTGFLILFFIGCEEPVKEPLDFIKEPVDSIKPEPDDNEQTDSVKPDPDYEPVIIWTDSTSAAERLFEKEVTLRLIEVNRYRYRNIYSSGIEVKPLLNSKEVKTNIVVFYTGNDTTGNKPLGMLEYGEVWYVDCDYKNVKNFYFYTDKKEYNRTLLMEPDHNNSYKKPFFEIYFNKEPYYKHQGVFSWKNFTSTNLVFEQVVLLNYKGKEVDYDHEEEYVEGSLDGAEYMEFKTKDIYVTEPIVILSPEKVREIVEKGTLDVDYEYAWRKDEYCIYIFPHYYLQRQYNYEYFDTDFIPLGQTSVTYGVHYTLLFEITDNGL